MYITDGCNIIVPRGDRADIPFVFTDEESGDPYVFDEGTQIRLDVFPVRGADSMISKTLEAPGASSGGTLIFSLSSEETDIPFGEYLYTLTAENGTAVDTLAGSPQSARFEIR